MGINKLIMILATLCFSATGFAQEQEASEKKPFNIYGDFATSLSFFDSENFSGGVQNPNSNNDDFNIDLIEIDLEKNWSNSKLHLSIGYGTTANAVNFGATNPALSQNTLNVMNAYYHIDSSYGLGFTVGKFESPVGHETYNHMDNSQFTRSYGFLLAPFFSTGAQLSYGQDMWKAGFIVSNGNGRDTDARDNNKTMAIVIDVDPMEALHVDLNYVTGTEGTAASSNAPAGTITAVSVNIIDFSVAYMINEMFDVALNYIDHGQQTGTATELKASSIAGYVNANFGTFGLGLRYEQFSYDGGVSVYNGFRAAIPAPAGTDNSISSITLAAKAEIDQNALVMLEYRMDSADDNGTFTEKNGTTATDAFNTITASLMYRF